MGIHVCLTMIALYRYTTLSLLLRDSFLHNCYPDATKKDKGPLFIDKYSKINLDDVAAMGIAHVICSVYLLIRMIITWMKKEAEYKYSIENLKLLSIFSYITAFLYIQYKIMIHGANADVVKT